MHLQYKQSTSIILQSLRCCVQQYLAEDVGQDVYSYSTHDLHHTHCFICNSFKLFLILYCLYFVLFIDYIDSYFELSLFLDNEIQLKLKELSKEMLFTVSTLQFL